MPKRSKRSRPSKGGPHRPDRPIAPRRPALASAWEEEEEVDTWQPPTVHLSIGRGRVAGSVHQTGLEDRPGSVHLAWLENQVVTLVNTARRRAGQLALRGDERLRTSARGYSTRMAEVGFFAHEDPDGSVPVDRMRAAGHPSPGGENIAQGQPSPEAVMHSWMNSPGHRANIVRPEFRCIGVGVYLGPGGPWWTQHFGY